MVDFNTDNSVKTEYYKDTSKVRTTEKPLDIDNNGVVDGTIKITFDENGNKICTEKFIDKINAEGKQIPDGVYEHHEVTKLLEDGSLYYKKEENSKSIAGKPETFIEKTTKEGKTISELNYTDADNNGMPENYSSQRFDANRNLIIKENYTDRNNDGNYEFHTIEGYYPTKDFTGANTMAFSYKLEDRNSDGNQEREISKTFYENGQLKYSRFIKNDNENTPPEYTLEAHYNEDGTKKTT